MKKILLLTVILFGSLYAEEVKKEEVKDIIPVCEWHNQEATDYLTKANDEQNLGDYERSCAFLRLARFHLKEFLTDGCQLNYKDPKDMEENTRGLLDAVESVPCSLRKDK